MFARGPISSGPSFAETIQPRLTNTSSPMRNSPRPHPFASLHARLYDSHCTGIAPFELVERTDATITP
jgi:hypothetical protein